MWYSLARSSQVTSTPSQVKSSQVESSRVVATLITISTCSSFIWRTSAGREKYEHHHHLDIHMHFIPDTLTFYLLGNHPLDGRSTKIIIYCARIITSTPSRLVSWEIIRWMGKIRGSSSRQAPRPHLQSSRSRFIYWEIILWTG